MGDRWTPLAVVVGALAIVLAGVGVGAVVVHDDGGGGRAAPEVTTTTAPVDTTTSTSVAATTTSPPTTATGRTTTTRRTTTTLARPTTTGPTATTVAGHPLCAAEQMAIRITIATSFGPGEPVGMSTTLRNKSSAPCYYQGFTVTMTFLDPGGRALVSQAVHADDVAERAFVPGQEITQEATWDPKVCQTPPCTEPPGIYEATADWSFSGGRYTARQQFIVRAS